MRALKDNEQLEYPNLGSLYSQVNACQITFGKKQRRNHVLKVFARIKEWTSVVHLFKKEYELHGGTNWVT